MNRLVLLWGCECLLIDYFICQSLENDSIHSTHSFTCVVHGRSMVVKRVSQSSRLTSYFSINSINSVFQLIDLQWSFNVSIYQVIFNLFHTSNTLFIVRVHWVHWVLCSKYIGFKVYITVWCLISNVSFRNFLDVFHKFTWCSNR